MSLNYILAIDAGTSGVRCLIVDFEGKVISLCRKDWSYRTPDYTGILGKEFHPADFWRIICDCIKEAINNADISAKDIVAVSATSQRQGVVFLDKEGRELYAGPNIDLRALIEGISIDSEFGDQIYFITGHKPSFLFVPAKLKWFKTNQPDIYKRISTVLTISDWIIYKLSGERVSEVCGASELGLIDIRSRQWCEELQNLLSLPDDIYPHLISAGSQVGRVNRQAACESGLQEGTLVVQGAPDIQCGLIGMDVKEKGEGGIVLGWSAPIDMITDEPILDPQGRIWTSCYPLLGKWILESNAGEAGNAYYWLKEILFDEEGSLGEKGFALMDQMALEIPPGSEGVLAFLGPTVMNMSCLGSYLGGFLFPLPLSLNRVQRSHLIRASLENLCFAVKANSLQLEAISGSKIRKVKVGGNLAKSRCLKEILPAVLDMPVFFPPTTEVSALGAAICAAVGSGVFSSLEEGIKVMVKPSEVIEPEPLSTAEYAEHYKRWFYILRSLEGLNKEV